MCNTFWFITNWLEYVEEPRLYFYNGKGFHAETTSDKAQCMRWYIAINSDIYYDPFIYDTSPHHPSSNYWNIMAQMQSKGCLKITNEKR